MGDGEYKDNLRDRVGRLEEESIRHHAKVDEQIRTLFAACRENADTAKTLLRTLVWTVVLIAVLGALGLLYGAVGGDGFNAVTRATREAGR